MTSLSPTQISALQLALANSEPGVVLINKTPVDPELVELIRRANLSSKAQLIEFVPAEKITEPNLLKAIQKTDFRTTRLIGEDGSCYAFPVQEIENHLKSLQPPTP